ncbi:hypothetical protein NDU88_003868 [Pleurodeles waltl]|uniref:Uncharacterized protein n=1 Tax=Pleurodeles waltl TaxID=8319 RepID=A0AAV7M4Q9_PLEWA|nr:hypothetical protein NDU88_003868 [Pleurodeles waltl]
MESSGLGFLLALASIGLLAESNPRGRKELDADTNGMQDGYFMDTSGGWRINNNEAPLGDWGDYVYLSGATNLVAYSISESHVIKYLPTFDQLLQIEMLFKIYDEVTMFELVELAPNSTENRCRDCCTPTPYDSQLPIMRREEGNWTIDHRASSSIWKEVVASDTEVNKTSPMRKSPHHAMDRCSHCCLLSVVQKVKRLHANGS